MTRAPHDPRETLPEVSEIVPGALYLGRRPTTYVGYSLVVSCEQHLARKPMDGYDGLVIHCPMRDEDDFAIDEPLVGAVAAAARIIVEAHQGHTRGVLVHCTGGLNRSAVVAARILEASFDMTAHEAVNLLRRSRDPFVLCNRQFERWVLREQLPTAETSMFRETT